MATRTTRKKVTSKTIKTSTPTTSKSNTTKTIHSKTALAIIGGVLLLLLAMFFLKNFLIAATVNGQPVSRISVIKELEKQSGKQTLEGMIIRILIQQEADKRNLKVTQEEIDAEIKKIEESLKGQQTTLDSALEAQGMTREDLTKDIRLQVLVQKLVEDKVEVTDEEVTEYIKKNADFLPEDATEEENLTNAREQLKQEKISIETQNLIDQLQKNAKTTFFVTY